MLKKLTKCLLVPFLLCSFMLPTTTRSIGAKNEHEQATRSMSNYMLYPKPQTITYQDTSYILQENLNVIYDAGIDKYTKNKLQEVAALKKLNVQISDQAVAGKTNIYVGIYNSNGNASTKIQRMETIDATLFEKTDAYYMKSDNGTISILGSDTDASFYGLATLYQIFAQMDSYRILNFEIQDYADVKSRGFIEGYYGNPWSQEDRVDLMKFGGYYKLNAYFYAPKDDPKHNAKWRELYTEEELNNIAALARAGNESKTRFVFALHPFMNAPMKFDTEANYQKDLKVLQTKFKQVIDQGVRQIAILDDDAALPGGKAENALKVVRDMTDWLKSVQQEIPDMKLTLPYVPANYMGDGSQTDPEFRALKQAPDNVQVVMTGGKIWGEVSRAFTEKFSANMGKGPFLWINWPCSDNSKKHLIMGGNSTFLHPNVDAEKIQGIMLNPMQQSEPSKVAIFANAAYSWNIWGSNEEAEQAWKDSFSFVDHNSAVPSKASDAYRELSKHMINQAMDNRVTALQESLDLKLILDPYKEKLSKGTITIDETEMVIDEFLKLEQAAKTYRNHAGNVRTRDQIIPWLNCWDDTTEAALSYLYGIKASIQKDITGTLRYFNEGKQAFERSKTYGYHYVDHIEYAEVGVQHIVPFIKTINDYVSNIVKTQIDPSIVTNKFITSRSDTPVGDLANVFDGKDATSISFRNPSSVSKGEYVGVMFSNEQDVKNVRFLLGDGKNHIDFAKAQYTLDGTTWETISETVYEAVEGEFQEVKLENLTLRAKGIRLIATRANVKDAWLQVNEIEVNKKKEATTDAYTGTLTLNGMSERGSNVLANALDGNINTEAWFAKGPYNGADRDSIPLDATLTLTFDNIKSIGKIYVAQGITSAGDVLSKADIDYLAQDDTWHNIGTMTNGKEQTINVAPSVEAKAIRIKNKKKTNGWWRLAEFQVFGPHIGDSEHVYTNVKTNLTALVEDSKATLQAGSISLKENDYIGVVLDTIRGIEHIDVKAIPTGMVLQTSKNAIAWETYGERKNVSAKYIRVFNPTSTTQTMHISSFVVTLEMVGKPKLLKATTAIDPNWGILEDMRPLKNDGNLFDGKLTTGAEIGGFPQKGEYALFDLGQTRTITSFRYYVVETQFNYIRDGIFELSDRPDAPDNEWKAVLNIGDGIENTESTDGNTPAKNYAEFLHDSKNPGNMYKEATNVNQSGRYLRIRFTASNQHRAVFFNELQINNGEYVSTEMNKDVIASVVEEPGKIPSNMFDKDILTTFKPSAANGNFVYYVSNPMDVRTIRFAQNGEISNANVTATLLTTTTKKRNKVTLGTLNQSVTDFMIPRGSVVLDVSVVWGDTIPEISEIILTGTDRIPDKTALKVEMEKEPDTQWITSSQAAYKDAQRVAQEVYKSVYATQDAVDMAMNALTAIRANAIMKADSTMLQQLVENRKEQREDGVEIYASRSYGSYEVAINNAKVALQDTENLSIETNQRLVNAIQKADTELVYSFIQIELAQVSMLNDVNKYPDENYTTQSFAAYKGASDSLKKMVEADVTTRQRPNVVSIARTAYQTALVDLVDITELTVLFANFDKYNAALYDTTTFNAYKTAIDEAKVLVIAGTKKEVADAVIAITEKEAALVLISTQLDAYIEELEKHSMHDYTDISYQVLATAIAEAKAILDTNDPILYKEHIQRLSAAKGQLVDIRQLNLTLIQASKYEQFDYTKDSYVPFDKIVKDSTKLKVNGTAKEIAEAIVNIKEAIATLQPLAKELEAYRNGVTLKAEHMYTQESYNVYRNKYQALMELAIDNTSVPTFQSVRSAFEKAEADLVLLDADYSAVEKALEKVPSELDLFTTNSVANLQNRIQEIVYGKKIDEQAIVDAYAKNIEKAIVGLTYKQANYDKIYELLSKLPSDTSIYTEESMKAVRDAIKAIDFTKTILEQDLVDRYTRMLQKAMDALVLQSKGNTVENVNTGDSVHTAGYMGILMVAGSIMGILGKKRRNLRS